MKTTLLISDDPARLNRELIHRFLSERSYWAQGVSPEMVDRSLDHSLCFGVYQAGQQVGFARVVTDFATFAWLADVFVVEDKRGKGIGKKLVAAVLGASPVAGPAAVHARDEGRVRTLCPVRLPAAGASRTFYGNPSGKQLQLWLLKWPLNPK